MCCGRGAAPAARAGTARRPAGTAPGGRHVCGARSARTSYRARYDPRHIYVSRSSAFPLLLVHGPYPAPVLLMMLMLLLVTALYSWQQRMTMLMMHLLLLM